MTDSRNPILRVNDLRTRFDVEERQAWAVGGVSFEVFPEEVFGIVGESGSGKSVTALSILRLIPDPPGHIESGEIHYGGRNLLELSYDEMREIRGRDIAMIFQEPMTSLNPVFTIGKQVMEPVMLHEKLDKAAAADRAVEVLGQVGIPDARARLNDYPHQFSGGMRQRVMIAMALICKPAILIADEPTTALDVTIQAQILELMQELQKTRKGASIILITHDLSVVAETCHRVMVMYGGKVQEVAPVRELFNGPMHPYTKGLLASIPREENKGEELWAIPGNVPSIFDFPEGCKFCNRCSEATRVCEEREPEILEVQPGHWVRCHLMTDAIGGEQA